MPSVVTTDGHGLSFGGVSLRALASEYGTPFFVYDGDAILRRADAVFAQFQYRPFRIHYSIKANPLVGLIRLLRGAGVGFDACSAGDLAAAWAAGCEPTEITFVGHGLSASDYEMLKQSGLRSVVADSEEQIRRLAGSPGLPAIGLRVNPNLDTHGDPHLQSGSPASRFGIAIADVGRAVALATSVGLDVEGLHAHIGSDLLEVEPYLDVFDRLLMASRSIDSLRWINLGGGYGFTDQLDGREFSFGLLGEAVANLLRSENKRRRHPVEIRIEPGGYLTMDAGLLIGEVVDTKQLGSELHRAKVVTTNTSSNHLMSAVALGVEHPVWVDTGRAPSAHEFVDVAGNLMHAGDILARGRRLPCLDIGDLIAFGRSGAYSSSRSTTFNGHGRPAEILVQDGVARLIRRRETPEDLIRLDRDVSGSHAADTRRGRA